MIFFETERLFVRNWIDADLPAFHALYNDAEVMRFFPRPIPMAECEERLTRWRLRGEHDGMTFAPLVRREAPDAGMIGFTGIFEITQAGLPHRGGHEIGWMIARRHWRQGFASEAAKGWLEHGWNSLGLATIHAFTAKVNEPSRAVMRSIGMNRVPDGDFDHPSVPDGPLRPHVLYEITRS